MALVISLFRHRETLNPDASKLKIFSLASVKELVNSPAQKATSDAKMIRGVLPKTKS